MRQAPMVQGRTGKPVKSQSAQLCSYCGKPLEPGSKFCTGCGKPCNNNNNSNNNQDDFFKSIDDEFDF